MTSFGQFLASSNAAAALRALEAALRAALELSSLLGISATSSVFPKVVSDDVDVVVATAIGSDCIGSLMDLADVVGKAEDCFEATACLHTFAAALRVCAGVSMLAEGGAAIGMDVGSTVAIGGLVGVVGPSTSWTLPDGEGDGASCDRNDCLEVGVTAIGTDTPVLKRVEPEGGGVSAPFINMDLATGSSCDWSATGAITGVDAIARCFDSGAVGGVGCAWEVVACALQVPGGTREFLTVAATGCSLAAVLSAEILGVAGTAGLASDRPPGVRVSVMASVSESQGWGRVGGYTFCD